MQRRALVALNVERGKWLNKAGRNSKRRTEQINTIRPKCNRQLSLGQRHRL
jgi:hypothetical protein